MKNIISFLSQLFSVKRCYECQNLGHFFCLECQKSLEIHHPHCCICKQYSKNFLTHEKCQKYTPLQQVIVLTHYKKGVKKLLRHGKYYNKYQAYEDIIIPYTDFFSQHISSSEAIFVPVPIHIFRRWGRGYNQAEKIATILGKQTGNPVDSKLLLRTKYTKHQSRLSKVLRFKNLKKSFKVSKSIYSKNTSLYIIDDITTTGSTLTEIAKVLEKSGFKDIRAIVLASD